MFLLAYETVLASSGQPMIPLKATVAQAGVALGIRSELFFQCRRALYGGTATGGP